MRSYVCKHPIAADCTDERHEAAAEEEEAPLEEARPVFEWPSSSEESASGRGADDMRMRKEASEEKKLPSSPAKGARI